MSKVKGKSRKEKGQKLNLFADFRWFFRIL